MFQRREAPRVGKEPTAIRTIGTLMRHTEPMGMCGRIRTAELELLAPSTRSNATRLRQLLHPEFLEIGRSGQRWTREDMIESFSAGDRQPAPETDEWDFTALTAHLVLVTYRIRVRATPNSRYRHSRHTAVWDTSSGQPRLRFHQGTPVLPSSI